MRMTLKRVLVLLLSLAMLISLCACGQKPEQTPVKENAGSTSLGLPAKTDKQKEQENSQESESIEWSQSGAASLALLRDRINAPDILFGMAYLGYVGGLFDNGFEQEFPVWLRDNNQTLLDEYPFIAEIDKNHIVGGAGHLYCIVPVDKNATISINRVQWNDKTKAYEGTDVLYRAETGEPVLLFANLDGVAYEPDTQLFITDNSGNTCEWYPALDTGSYLVPCITEDGVCYSWDFTDYQHSAAAGLDAWLYDGWLGPTALGLAGSENGGTTWSASGTAWDTDRYAHFMLTFYPGDETGGVVNLDWQYDGEEEFEEQWSGFWTIETELDMPSHVTLSLSLVGGKSYDTTEGPLYISETYHTLLSPSGEELLISSGENSICLPFMSQYTLVCVLTQACG